MKNNSKLKELVEDVIRKAELNSGGTEAEKAKNAISIGEYIEVYVHNRIKETLRDILDTSKRFEDEF